MPCLARNIFRIHFVILLLFELITSLVMADPLRIAGFDISKSKRHQIKMMVSESANTDGADGSYPVLELFANSRSVSTSDFLDSYPDQLIGLITANNRTRRLLFRKNLDLLSANYKEIYYENSKRIVAASNLLDSKAFCYYHGTANDDSSSYATLNLCNQGFHGTVFIDRKHYVIENSRLLRPNEYYPGTDHFKCGHESKFVNHIDGYARRKRALETKPAYYEKFVTWQELYIEFAIVFDNSMFKKYGSDKKRLFDRAKELVNFVNAYYQPVRIKVALVGVEIWSEKDRVVVSTSGDATLDQFLIYRRINLIHDFPNDHAQLLTNVTFNGGVVGKALKGTMCSADLSGAVVMDHDRFKSVSPIAATMAHEMGHNFGMEHDNDTCECPQQRCLMAASSSGAGNVYWSSCSMEYLSWSISHGSDYCLRNKPPTVKEPGCGNGFVDDGEECDCGFPEICDNPCCNANTCRFVSGAVCANGGCCDVKTCQFMPLAAVCREANGECDLPEYCNGKSENCPKNSFKQNGIACQDGQAYCYNGTCGSHSSQCRLLWGPTGQMAPPECFSLNERGDQQGHCGIDIRKDYFPCDEKDSMCGLLQCTHKTERTGYGDRSVVRMLSSTLLVKGKLLNCHSAMIDLGLERPNPGLVPNGATCGDGKMCQAQKCVLVKDVLAENSCPSNCHDSGICNNFGNCHCISGYGGVDCSIPGLGGSIDSGPASTGAGRFNVGIGILIFLLVVLPLVTITVTVLYRKRIIKAPRFKIIDLLFKPKRSKSRPTSAAFSDISQSRVRKFDSTSIGRKAPPIIAFSAEAQRQSSPQVSPRDGNGALPSTAAAIASTSSFEPVSRYGFMSAPVQLGPSFGSSTAPPRPDRPKDEILEKYYTDAASLPRVGFAGGKQAGMLSESFASEVLAETAVDPNCGSSLETDYGPAIIPQRRAPPPPIEEEATEDPGANTEEVTMKTSVKDKKRFFESNGSTKRSSGVERDFTAVLKRLSKQNSINEEKPKGNDRKAPEISFPSEPMIGGAPVTQASSLLIIPHLESQTLPRKKASDTTLSTGASYRARQLDQRKSSAIDEADVRKKRPTSNIVQRSQSSVSGCRPTIAPPPPPPQVVVAAKPALAPKPSSLSAKPSLRLPENESLVPLVGSEIIDSDSSASSHGDDDAKRRSATEATENYYDVIASPVDEKEEIYADIDEIRASMKNTLSSGSLHRSPPSYGSLHPGAVRSNKNDIG